jgi:two-component system sensor kinase
VGNWEWNVRTNELHWSDEIYRIFGLTPQEFGATYDAFLQSVHPEDREHVQRAVDASLHEKKPYAIDHRIVLPDSSVRIVHEQGEATLDEAGTPVRMFGTVQDITELRRAETALRESQARLASIIESAMDAIITTDADQRILLFNASAEQIFRCSAAQALRQPVDRFIPVRFRARHRHGVLALNHAERQDQLRSRREVIGLRADGEEFPCEIAISAVEVHGQRFHTAVVRDITTSKRALKELERSREMLRDLAAHLQSIREEERSTIAREVHDELGQALTGLKIDLSWLTNHLPDGFPDLRSRAKGMLSLLDTTIQTVRRIATELRPGVLDDLGLVAAIEWQAHEFQARTGIRCQFTPTADQIDLNRGLSTAVFRTCQEALTNVARHALATTVKIGLQEKAGHLILTVEDNGQGITDREITDRRSLGLLGMRERASIIGGTVTILGRPGQGTAVRLEVPLSTR